MSAADFTPRTPRFAVIALFTLIAGADASAVELSCGTSHSEAIEPGAPDLHTFEASAGDVISLSSSWLSGSAFVVRIDLFAPSSGVDPALEDLPGSGNVHQITITESGTHRLRVRDSDNANGGSYRVELEWLTVGRFCGESLACGASVRSDLLAGEHDVYTFEGVAGDVLSLSSSWLQGSAFLARLDVFGPSSGETPLLEDLPGNENIHDLVLPEDGVYRLRVRDNDFHGGAYRLELHRTVPEDDFCGVSLTCGESISGSLLAGEHDFYSFVGAAGDVLSLSSSWLQGSAFFARLDVFGPSSGETPLFVDLPGNENIHDLALPEDGVYRLRVRDNDFHGGSYRLELHRTVPEDDFCGMSLTCGESISGSLLAGEHDFYSFVGAAGDVLSLSSSWLQGSAFFTRLDVFGPSSTVTPLFADLPGNENIHDLALPEDGVYRLRVRDNDFHGGSYRLELHRTSPEEALCAQELVCGESVASDLLAGEHDLYSFQGVAGDALSLSSAWLQGSAFFATLDVFAPSSTTDPILSDLPGNGNIHDFELTETGVYRIRVRDNDFHPGSYRLSLARLNRICDCNENGIADALDIEGEPSLDADGDGVIDGCKGNFIRGDANADEVQDVSDAITILLFLFTGEAEVGCRKTADTDDTGELDITDAVFLLRWLFVRGDTPPAPLEGCGQDPTPDALTCASYPPCS